MIARLLLISIAVLLCTLDAHAGVTIWIETEHDALGARDECGSRNDIAKRQVMLMRLERKLLDEITSKDQLIAKYGAPKPFDISRFVRPLGAPAIVSLENIRSNEINGLMDRSLYFEINRSCVILVFFSTDGKPFLPSVLFWTMDNDLPKMTDVALCDKRLEWESSRLDSVLAIAGVAELDLTPTDDEMRRNREAAERMREHFDHLGRTKP